MDNHIIMEGYETLVDAINALRKEGYTADFNLRQNSLEWSDGKIEMLPNEFEIDKFYRFEGDSDPADEVVVYAISSRDHKLKGVLVNAFGIYSEGIADEIISKLKAH